MTAPERIRITSYGVDDVSGAATGQKLAIHAGTEYVRADLMNEIAALRMEAEEAEMEVAILREIRSKLEAALRNIAFSDTQSFHIDVKVNGKSVDHEPRYVDEADVVRIVKIAGDALK